MGLMAHQGYFSQNQLQWGFLDPHFYFDKKNFVPANVIKQVPVIKYHKKANP